EQQRNVRETAPRAGTPEYVAGVPEAVLELIGPPRGSRGPEVTTEPVDARRAEREGHRDGVDVAAIALEDRERRVSAKDVSDDVDPGIRGATSLDGEAAGEGLRRRIRVRHDHVPRAARSSRQVERRREGGA